MVRWSLHAVRAALDDQLTQEEVIVAVADNGRVIEDYPDHWLGACCLLLARLPGGAPIHVVMGHAREPWTVITVYVPDSAEWNDDFIERRR